MSCPVCNAGERYMLADLEHQLLMGYVNKPKENPEEPTSLDIFILPKSGEDGEVQNHQQVLVYCPICGEQLCSDSIKEQIQSVFEHIHANRVELRKAISGEDGGDNAI